MPLHDWTNPQGWEGVHTLWIVELLRWIKPLLPAGYRAYVGTVPTVAVGAPPERPDVTRRRWTPEPVQPTEEPAAASGSEPDEEVAVAAIDPNTAVYVECQGRLTAAVELISPRNKDRPASRATYVSRYVGYLLEGVNLLLVDVHRRPLGFSFADQIAHELQIARPPLPAPLAAAYRVGEPAATGGRLLAMWRRPLAVGAPLPVLPLPLTVHDQVLVDLEQTYQRAADDAYLS